MAPNFSGAGDYPKDFRAFRARKGGFIPKISGAPRPKKGVHPKDFRALRARKGGLGPKKFGRSALGKGGFIPKISVRFAIERGGVGKTGKPTENAEKGPHT